MAGQVYMVFLITKRSTTHSIIGAVLGVGIAAFGFDTPDWSFKGVGGVIASWFISPVVSYVVFDLTPF
jgi:sodium-dependent phosphate transporter